MFQTSHPYSSFHAAARCVSGGPIYFTDEPGQHDLALIAAMTARTIHSNTIILRPSVIGKTVGVYTGYEEERLLKVGTFTGGTGGVPILALFNVNQRPLSELVDINSFPGIESDQEYIVRAHTTGEISPPLRLDSQAPVISLEVEVKGYEILSAFPLRSLPSPTNASKTLSFAPLGLLGKMTGAAAIISSSATTTSNNRLHLTVILKALGTLGVYISVLWNLDIERDFLILLKGKVIPLHTARVSEQNPLVLEIDAERAWEEMGLVAGWGNEVDVEVFLGGGSKEKD